MSDDLALLDATAQAELVRQRKASPRELVDAAIARIQRVNPKLNAVIIQRFEKARAEAAAPDLPAGPSAPQRRAGSWGHAHRHSRALAAPAARGAGHARLVPSLETLLDAFGEHHQIAISLISDGLPERLPADWRPPSTASRRGRSPMPPAMLAPSACASP